MDGTGRLFPQRGIQHRPMYSRQTDVTSQGYIRNSNLRIGILIAASAGAIWSLASGTAAFRNVSFLNSNNESALGKYYIILGLIFIVIMLIEIFGVTAVWIERMPLVRIYMFLSGLAAVLTAVIYIIQAIVHSKFKDDIINICITANEGAHLFFTGFFGPVDAGIVTAEEAQQWCAQQFDHYSGQNIFALIGITSIAIMLAVSVFFYLRQLRSHTGPTIIPMHIQGSENYNSYNQAPYNNATQTRSGEGSNETLHVPDYGVPKDPYGGETKDTKDPFAPTDQNPFNNPPPLYEGKGRPDADQKAPGYEIQ